MSKYKPFWRCRDGVVRCAAHASSGKPRFHTEECADCQTARAKGIIRPNASEFTADQKRAVGFHAAVGFPSVNRGKTFERQDKAREAMKKEFRETMPRREVA